MLAVKVSIVIPVRNREIVLPRLFRSLDALWSGDALEIILVDNGSTDYTLPLCNAYAVRGKHPTMVLQEPLPGANRARNRGLQAASGEWVYFFDSDDELSHDFLLNLLPRGEGKDMIAFPTRMEMLHGVRTRDFVPSSSVASQILSSTLNTQGVIWHTDFLRSIGGWNESLTVWQDWELGIRALTHKPAIAWCGDREYHTIHLRKDSITATTTVTDRHHTLLAVLPLVQTDVERRALYLRSQILRGKSHEALPFTLNVPPSTHIVGTFIYLYVRIGFRGAWRICHCLCLGAGG